MNRAKIDAITRRLTDDGKLIEVGWLGLQALAIPVDASPLQLKEMRNAFFAGAQHLYGSIMSILDPGEEPTEKDLERLQHIHDELQAFIKEYEKEHGLQ